MDKIMEGGRQIGKSFATYQSFINSVKSGKNSIIIGSGYVVISHEEFKRLNRNLCKGRVPIRKKESKEFEKPSHNTTKFAICPVCGGEMDIWHCNECGTDGEFL